MTVFNYDRFFHQNYFSFYSYEKLKDLVNDEDAIKAHLKNIEIPVINDPRDPLGELKIELSNILLVFGNQMIIHHCTVLDSMVENFFFSIFASKPEIMKTFFATGEMKDRLGFSFNGFLESESKEEYMQHLAKRAANVCAEGGPKKFFKRLRQITRSEFVEVDMEILNDLYNTRNSIIHDNLLYQIDIERMNEYTNTLQEVLFELHEVLTKMNIETKNSYLFNDLLRSGPDDS